MNLGGLIARAALLKEQMKKQPCKRCGLHYDPIEMKQCPHCSHLDEPGLAKLLEQKENEIQSNKSLGFWFFIGAIVLLFIMIISA
ncbi:MAG: hypothetical protein HYZ31_00795 [Gammaproteobacteria bacterium]|nr:hypothetical protein [Gammaproteobacteria bacterium]